MRSNIGKSNFNSNLKSYLLTNFDQHLERGKVPPPCVYSSILLQKQRKHTIVQTPVVSTCQSLSGEEFFLRP